MTVGLIRQIKGHCFCVLVATATDTEPSVSMMSLLLCAVMKHSEHCV